MENYSRCIEINVLNAKTSSASVGFLPDPPPGALPLDPRWGLCPQTPIIGSRSRAGHGCVYY